MINIHLKKIRIFIDNNESIKITHHTDIEKIPGGAIDQEITIEGSPTNDAWSSMLFDADVRIKDSVVSIRNTLEKLKNTSGFDWVSVNRLLTSKANFLESEFKKFINSPNPAIKSVLPWFANGYWSDYSGHTKYWKDYYDRLSDDMKNSYYGKLLKKATRPERRLSVS